MQKFVLFILGFFCVIQLSAQDFKQVIRGSVIDKESKSPLPGASVILTSDTVSLRGVTTDANGFFRIEQVPLGRQDLKITFIGYKPLYLNGITITSGKEVIVTVELEESITSIAAVEISATRKDQAINEMAVVSARTFSIEETDRYAGSRGDPARMASNFAGVQGANDARNDIVVRGNAPMGVLWRLEGIDIPNPNHFAISGTSGGPVSILNNKVLSNSDFLTSAFPAEYGNSVAGIFDVKMKNGNNEKHEFTGQFGFLGTELTAEGPISKEKRSSYLFNYRYSTLKLFEALNVSIGTSAVPMYQDAAFKLNFPTKKGNLSFFGIGGKSSIDIILSKQVESTEELYGSKDRDQYFGTSMGVSGASYTHYINPTAYTKLTVSGSYAESHSLHNLIRRDSSYSVTSLNPILVYKSEETKLTAAYFLNKKVSSRHTIKPGFLINRYQFNMSDSIFNNTQQQFVTRLDHTGSALLIQPYIQWKVKITDDLEFISGIHAQYFSLNRSSSIEPRGGLKWRLKENHALGLGAGMHSQLQPTYIYFAQSIDMQGNVIQHNKGLDFTRSAHYVLSYDYNMARNLRFKTEIYYQQLYNIPVEFQPSAYTILNQGASFTRLFPDSLQNTGTGKNQGIEFTLERFFSKSYFFLITTSFYQSKYKGSDGIERNTDYNGRFATNILAGREIKTGKKTNLGISTKITWAGGRRYTPIDINASSLANEAVYITDQTNSLQFKDYFRTDLRINYKINSRKIAHEIAIDFVNVSNSKNILALSYAPNPNNPTVNPLREEYQLGFLPLFYYKIDF
ncbi:MAG: TonB-dependent receptor [Bacteroidetes bacterium]|nr:TonB-dependent receptor [Bacteroidota bacterium]HET6244434.1 TonB-dependent receptor [Bacteroidia bacterium]